MYDLAMTIYFGMYGATMTTNSELFWGPDSIMMLPFAVWKSNRKSSRRGIAAPSRRRDRGDNVAAKAWGARNLISTQALTKKNNDMKYAWFHVTNVFTQSRKARGPPPPLRIRYQLPSPQAPKAHAQ